MIKDQYKKWIGLLLLTGFCYLIAGKTHSNLFRLAFCFLLTFIIFDLLYLLCVFLWTKISISRYAPSRIEEDQTLVIKLTGKIQGFMFFVQVVIEDFLPCADKDLRKVRLTHYFSKDEPEFLSNYSCACNLRGIYNLGPIQVYFFDPLGLFYFKKTYSLYTEVHVRPKTFPIRSFPPLQKGALPWYGIETTHVSGDEDEYFGLREYRAGDVINRIHWLSTARKNKLIVKQFQRQSFYRATLLFTLEKDKNYGQGKESVAEYMIRIAASVASHLAKENVALEVMAHVGEFVHIAFNKGPDHIDNILSFLTGAKAESKVSLGELFEDYSHFIAEHSNVIIVMLDQDWEHLAKMLPLEKRNIFLVPLMLVSSTFKYDFKEQELLSDVRLKLSRKLNFAPLFFSRGQNLNEVFIK